MGLRSHALVPERQTGTTLRRVDMKRVKPKKKAALVFQKQLFNRSYTYVSSVNGIPRAM